MRRKTNHEMTRKNNSKRTDKNERQDARNTIEELKNPSIP